jgi:hypothetical protein
MRLVGLRTIAIGLTAVAALLLTFLAVAVGRSTAQEESHQELEKTCVKAGLAYPHGLLLRFHLQIDSHSTGPWPFLEYNVASLPQECAGYRRTFFLKVRYKTTLRHWRTFRGFNELVNPELNIKQHPLAWIPVVNSNNDTGYKTGNEWASLEFSKAPWGKVQHVKARGRLWVENLETGRLVGRETFPIRTKFCRAPKVSAPRWCD